jgi:hypothetical protein
VLDDQFVCEELQGVGVAVPRAGKRHAGSSEQVGVLEPRGGELATQPVDDSDGGIVGSGVGPRRVQSRIPESRWSTAVAAALMYGPSGVEAT